MIIIPYIILPSLFNIYYFAGMRSSLNFSFLFLLFFGACQSNDSTKEKVPTSENDADAARNFINAILKGNLKEGRAMLMDDSTNNQFFDAYERIYKTRMDPEDRRGYREASINIHSIRAIDDSTSIINYANSYKKQSDSLKVIKLKGEWRVDLKYSFPATMDSLP